MKKIAVTTILVLMLAACGNEGRKVEQDVDQVMKKVENGAEVLADSAKEKYKDVRDHLDTALDRDDREERDSARF